VYKVPALTDEPALALFEQRARAADADFALFPDTLPFAVALCRRLDGLPLAIELAAAHADRLTPEELVAVISAHLDALGEGPRDLPARQQTLRGTVDWSYALLEEEQRRLFCALAAFAGGCTPDAVLAVVAEDDVVAKQLDALVDKSLLVVEDDEDGQRYRMLETIRAYANAQLDVEPDADLVVARHAAFYLRFAEESALGLTGPQQAAWAGRIEREYQNLRAAFTRADHSTAARICLGLWRYWRNGSHLGEGRDWLDRVLAPAEGPADDLAGQLLHAGAILAATQDDHERATLLATDSLRRARAIGDLTTIAQANNALGIAAIGAGDYQAAVWHFRQSLEIWQDMGHGQGTAAAFGNLTKVSLRLGDVAAADRYAAECLILERANGNTRGILLALECVGQIRLAQGDPASARTALEESLALSRSVGDAFGAAMSLHQLGLVAHAEGDDAAAVRLLAEAAMRRYEVGDRMDLAISLDVLAHVLLLRRPAVAARLLGAADEVRHKHRLPVPPDGETFRAATSEALVDLLDEPAEEIARGRAIPLDLVLDEAQELSSGRGAQ
jgi:tetratricopeptide (TPR) repeat protein